MNQRYDLAAISLLIFSSVIVAALIASPKPFAIQDWQPLMAAFVALGAAALAYNAAMAKVELDRQLAIQADARRKRGVFLRLRYTASIIRHEAKIREKLVAPPEDGNEKKIRVGRLVIQEPEKALDEAWENLDCMPPNVAVALSQIKDMFYNIKIIARKDVNFEHTVSEQPSVSIKMARETYKGLILSCDTLTESMDGAIAGVE